MSSKAPKQSAGTPPTAGGTCPQQPPAARTAPLRVAVGLSGGVDSAVAAALLLEQGYAVIGLTMLIWDPAIAAPEARRGGCFGPGEAADLARARAVAERLGIEHHAIALPDAFRREVLDRYRAEYLGGRTPNPCAICNPRMKFDLLPRQARAQGLVFDAFATGHYARIVPPPEAGRPFGLLRGLDRAKDQSYFLARLSPSQMAGILLPLGDRTKTDVRAMARRLNMDAAADAAESQDFFEGEDHAVLFDADSIAPGPVVDTEGRPMGIHRGIIHYTVGQRRGLGLAAGRKLYVQRICAATHTIVVAERDQAMQSGCRVRDPRWIAGHPPASGTPCQVQLRYRHVATPASLQTRDADTWQVDFATPQFAVAPGQMAVFYDGEAVLGGGWIE